jgi:hypothetical protein
MVSLQKPGDLVQMDTVRTAQRLQAAKEDFLKGGLSDKEIGIKIGLSVKQTEKVHNWWISHRRAKDYASKREHIRHLIWFAGKLRDRTIDPPLRRRAYGGESLWHWALSHGRPGEACQALSHLA